MVKTVAAERVFDLLSLRGFYKILKQMFWLSFVFDVTSTSKKITMGLTLTHQHKKDKNTNQRVFIGLNKIDNDLS